MDGIKSILYGFGNNFLKLLIFDLPKNIFIKQNQLMNEATRL